MAVAKSLAAEGSETIQQTRDLRARICTDAKTLCDGIDRKAVAYRPLNAPDPAVRCVRIFSGCRSFFGPVRNEDSP